MGIKGAETGRDEENYQKKYIVYCVCSYTPVHGSLARARGLLQTKHKYIFYKARECFSRNFFLKNVSTMRKNIVNVNKFCKPNNPSVRLVTLRTNKTT